MKNIKIGQRLMGGFAAVLLITVAVTVAASLAMGRVRDDSAKITGDCLPGMERIGGVRATSEGQIGRVKVAVLANDARQRATARSEATEMGSQNGTLLDEYEKTITTAEDRALFNTVKDRRRDWVAARTGIFSLLDQNQEQAAVAALESTGQPAFEAYIKVVRELFDFNKRNGEEAGQAIASSVRSVSLVLWLGMGATLILGFGIAMVIGRSMTGPVGVLVEYVERAAAGDLGRECGYDGQDEIGILSQRLTKMSSDLGQAREGERTRAEQDRKDQAELQRRVDAMLVVLRSVAQGDLTQTVPVKGSDAVGQLGEAFESLVSDLNRDMTAISRNAQALAAAAEELTATSQQMAANSEETSVQAASVSAGSEQVSHSVQSVSAATEQMTASIREIAKNAQDATGVATSAVNMAESTNATMAKLSASSEEIGKVVKVITSIAEQTNLLALNATIEAARAGAAGKGFAVVANEVKELAKETAKATEEISAKIGAMQSDAGQAVLAIQEIRTVIGQVNNISSTIASAVEEQTATTNEIGRNVSQAAQGSTDIARNIAGVASAAKGVAVGATDSQTASNSLSQMANELQGIVAKFKLGADRSAGRHGAPALSSSLSRNGGAAGHASQSSVA